MMSYEVTVKVSVDADKVGDYKGAKVSRESVVVMVREALDAYVGEMNEAISSTGDWSADGQVIATCMEYEVK